MTSRVVATYSYTYKSFYSDQLRQEPKAQENETEQTKFILLPLHKAFGSLTKTHVFKEPRLASQPLFSSTE